jgi:hypothetical protein
VVQNALPKEEDETAERARAETADRDTTLAREADGKVAAAAEAQAGEDLEAPRRQEQAARPVAAAAAPPPPPAEPPMAAPAPPMKTVAQGPAPETRAGKSDGGGRAAASAGGSYRGAGAETLGTTAPVGGAAVAADAPAPALDRARSARAGRDFGRAAKLYEQAIRETQGADQVAALVEAAETYERLGDTPRALALYDRAARAAGPEADRARAAAGRLRSLQAAPKTKAPAARKAEPSMNFDDAEQAAPSGAEPPDPAAPAVEKR